jgi:hypothetical protein
MLRPENGASLAFRNSSAHTARPSGKGEERDLARNRAIASATEMRVLAHARH